jgi:hypothetical protein
MKEDSFHIKLVHSPQPDVIKPRDFLLEHFNFVNIPTSVAARSKA